MLNRLEGLTRYYSFSAENKDMSKKLLMDMTDEELTEFYRNVSQPVVYCARDCELEMDRRTTKRHTRKVVTLTILSAMTSIAAVVIALVKALNTQ